MILRQNFYAFLGCLAIAASGAQGETIIGFAHLTQTQTESADPNAFIAANDASGLNFIGGYGMFLGEAYANQFDISVGGSYPGMFGYISKDQSTTGRAELRFDATPYVPTFPPVIPPVIPPVNPTGLGGENFTRSGQYDAFAIEAGTDLGASLTLLVYSDADHYSSVTVTLGQTGIPTNLAHYLIPFSTFTAAGALGGVNFEDVGAIQIFIDGKGADDIFKGTSVALGSVSLTAVPEPSTVLMSGIGFLGGALALWHRRSRGTDIAIESS